MYIANLRPKQGELRALQKLVDAFTDKNDLEQKFLPNFIVPLITEDEFEGIDDDKYEEVIKEHFDSILNKIEEKYPFNKLLDIRGLPEWQLTYFYESFNKLKNNNSKIIYPISILTQEHNSIEYVRVTIPDLNPFFYEWVVNNIDVLPPNIMIDLEKIDGRINEDAFDSITKFINSLNGNNIIIASGSIPEKVPTKSDENYTQRRYELDLFKSIESKITNTVSLTYSDYTIVTPLEIIYDGPIIPSVQIKYTLSDKYLFVRNGQRQGNYSIYEVAQEISQHEEFNSSLSWGDNWIKEVAELEKNKGNPSTWVSVGISHHIHKVLSEI